MDDAPKLDSRSYDEIVAHAEALAVAYTASYVNPTTGARGPWRPRRDGTLDFGGTLIRLFATMVEHLIQQLDHVPRKHQLAFTSLLGARRISARAARAPITFTVAPGEEVVEVPRGAQIAATTPTGSVTFETEATLALTRAQLSAVFVRDVTAGRYADRTSPTAPYAALAAAQPLHPGDDPTNKAIEHQVLMSFDELLARPGAARATLVVDGGAARPPAIAWSSLDGTSFAGSANGNRWSTAIQDLGKIGAGAIGGLTRRWVVGTVPAADARTPVTMTVTLDVAAVQARLPDAGFWNTQKLDFSRDVRPFGERGQFGDAFYISSLDAFALAGAQVVIDLKFTRPVNGLNPQGLALTWEAWSGNGWVSLGTTKPGDTLAWDTTKAFTTDSGRVTLSLAKAIPISEIGGIAGRWIRVRITAGAYGTDTSVDSNNKVVLADFRPPLMSSILLSWSASVVQPASAVWRRTALTYEDITSVASHGPCVVYRDTPEQAYQAGSDPSNAVYLGFDSPFEPAPVTLYLAVVPPPAPEPAVFVEPPPRRPPQLVWEYWNGAWTRIDSLEDETLGFSRSGTVRFVPRSDAAPQEMFGKRLHWLRARVDGSGFAPMPRLAWIGTNTIWASNAHVNIDEPLGASNGARGQVFRLSQVPVLEGQQIEVGEPDMPPPAELEALRDMPDEVVVVRDDHPRRGPLCWVRWREVADFWGSGPRDRHYTFDPATGEVTFGDGTRGMIPPLGQQNVRAALYRSGGGAAGNVPAGAIAQLKTALPMVDAAINREPAVGGADLEPEAAMMDRASRTLRHGGRAVTAADFADLALESSRAIARAVTISPSFSPISQADGPRPGDVHRDGKVIVVVVPATTHPGEAPTIDQLALVEDYLRARAVPAARIEVIGPSWVPCDITVHVVATSLGETEAVLARARAAIAQLLDPLTGGEGSGWHFGRRPRRSDLIACIAAVDGVDHISYLRIDCDAPFDKDDTASDAEVSIDELSLLPRLLVYARSITVTTPQRVNP